jgi:diguanylate cyclase (GGDEF)-like protein
MKHDADVLGFKLDKMLIANGLAEAVAKRDYEQLKTIVAPLYERLKRTENAVNILTFRSNEGITLFRAHKPEYFGDELNEKRTLIIDTNTLQRSFIGFEVGNLKLTYRVTKPIFYNDMYVGNVEVGITPTHFLEDLNAIFKTDMGIAIDKLLLNIMINKTVTQINSKYALIEGGSNLKMHFEHKHDEDSELYKIDMSIPLKNHLSQTLGYLVVGFDISTIAKENKEFMFRIFFMILVIMLLLVVSLHIGFDRVLKYFTNQVYTDHLTQLQNRYALNSVLGSKKTYLLILSNIKEFSLINEFYGVDVGNEILTQVAEAFRDFAQEQEMLAYRVSSDEYVLLKQEDSFNGDKYLEIIENLHNKINSLSLLVEGVDESIGIELYSGMAFDHEHSLEDAQMALKKAKKQSLPFLMYSQKVDTKQQSQTVIQVKRRIKYALEHKNIIPFFQPVTNKDGQIVKYEALVRIVEYENGKKIVLPPLEFLDIAIKSGLYIKIAQDMLEQSFSFFANRDEKISVNFLPNDFFNSSLMNILIKCVKEFDSPQRVVVEITEQDNIEDFDKLIEVVEELRELGVLIAIDDFGSGYANYAHILRLRPDYIKIDGSLIQNILTNNDSKILVKSIVRFAQELNTATVAEYVENEEIFELLKEYGVDEFQGYYFGRPTDLINAQTKHTENI